jgi:hypothetical protein
MTPRAPIIGHAWNRLPATPDRSSNILVSFSYLRNSATSTSWFARQREDAGRASARTRERHIDRVTICRGSDAIQPRILHRAVLVNIDAADRYHAPILTHADDRVIASIGNVEV